MNQEENKTILYVDDEEINLFIFQKRFEANYSIIPASSGEEALAMLATQGNEIDVVISDMRMPLMSGVDFVKKAKSDHSGKVYFILTGYEYNEEVNQAQKDGLINRLFSKPFDFDEIKQAIEEELR